MFFFPKAIAALSVLAQVNNVQSQEMSMISTLDSHQLGRVLEQGCDYTYKAPTTDLDATRNLITLTQESLTNASKTHIENPNLLKHRSQVIARISDITSQMQRVLSKKTSPKELVGPLGNLAGILESNNMELIHPGLATTIQLLISRVATMFSSNHIAIVEKKIYAELTGQDQTLQLALSELNRACDLKSGINPAYTNYCNEYFYWHFALYLIAYEQLLDAPTFTEQEMIKLTMQKYHTAFSNGKNTCNVLITIEASEILEKISEYIAQSNAHAQNSAHQM